MLRTHRLLAGALGVFSVAGLVWFGSQAAGQVAVQQVQVQVAQPPVIVGGKKAMQPGEAFDLSGPQMQPSQPHSNCIERVGTRQVNKTPLS